MRLWDWAIAAYAAAGAETALHGLQDDHGQCVSFLLWAAWADRTGRPLGPTDLARGASLARRWESDVTEPLRCARRALKSNWPDVADVEREALRTRVKQDELDAEHALSAALEALTPTGGEAGVGVAGALAAAAAAWDAPTPTAALDRLARIFEALDF